MSVSAEPLVMMARSGLDEVRDRRMRTMGMRAMTARANGMLLARRCAKTSSPGQRR